MTPTQRFPAFLLFIVAMLVVSPSTRAWDTAGHRAICEIAWDALQPAAERGVREALRLGSKEAFAALCVHAEITEKDLMILPAGARGIEYERDCPEQRSCPVREIERAVADLNSGRGDRGEAILRLAHFTGEVHQPLSVGYAADRNGLDIEATYLGRPTTMHRLWHSELLAAPRPPRPDLDTGFELRLITNFLERPRWAQSSPIAWATESYWIMRTPATGYVGNPGGLAFDEVYVTQNKVTVLDQIEKAGVRLGHLLNRTFGDPGESIPGVSPAPN
ncbi:MAG: S1/P1 nuclease [Rhodospirillaceae bacterium]